MKKPSTKSEQKFSRGASFVLNKGTRKFRDKSKYSRKAKHRKSY